MPLSNGTKLGPYEILAPIGEGGMGEVYKGRDTRLDRIVAIKTLEGTWSPCASTALRFLHRMRVRRSRDHARGVKLTRRLLHIDAVTHHPQLKLFQADLPAISELFHPVAALGGIRHVDDNAYQVIAIENPAMTPSVLRVSGSRNWRRQSGPRLPERPLPANRPAPRARH
jgi:serine/threonine protein kinase